MISLKFDLLYQVGDLLYDRCLVRLLSFLLLLDPVCFHAFWTNIRIVSIQLTVKAHHALILCVVLLVRGK